MICFEFFILSFQLQIAATKVFRTHVAVITGITDWGVWMIADAEIRVPLSLQPSIREIYKTAQEERLVAQVRDVER